MLSTSRCNAIDLLASVCRTKFLLLKELLAWTLSWLPPSLAAHLAQQKTGALINWLQEARRGGEGEEEAGR